MSQSLQPQGAKPTYQQRTDAEMRRRVEERKQLYKIFLHTFSGGTEQGEAHAQQEMERYWQSQGFVPLQALVEHMLEWAKQRTPPIRPEVGMALMEEFRESMVHEKVTDYIHNYQGPLIEALARRYNAMQPMPTCPVYLSEVDLSNIGGLNKAMVEAITSLYHSPGPQAKNLIQRYEKLYIDPTSSPDEGEKIRLIANGRADDVIRHICDVLQRHLRDNVANKVTCVRKGGDELRFYISLKNSGHRNIAGATSEDLADITAIARANSNAVNIIDGLYAGAQQELATYFKEAGLTGIPHLKSGGLPGMGVRSATLALSTSPYNEHIEGQYIDAGLLLAKRKMIRAAEKLPKVKPTTPNLGRIEPSKHIRMPEPAHDLTVYALRDGKPLPFEEVRLTALHSYATAVAGYAAGHDTPLNAAEEAAVKGIHALTVAVDPVTKLPLASRMEKYVMPVFYAQHPGDAARLVVMDFSNVGGANVIGSFVGDAAIRQNVQAVREALKNYHAGLYKDAYLSGAPGGKVVMLLPASVCNGHNSFSLEEFQKTLALRVRLKGGEALALTAEEKESVNENIRMLARYKNNPERFELGNVAMQNVCNPKKPSQKGVRVYTAMSEDIAQDNPTKLSHFIKELEAKTQIMQQNAEKGGYKR